MGFNNDGVERLIDNVRRADYRGVLGINIGKNFDTPIERAADDYLHCLRKVYALASYVTVNISSPNTRNLRQLREAGELENLLGRQTEQRKLADQHGKYVPLALKIAPISTACRSASLPDCCANTASTRDRDQYHPRTRRRGGHAAAPGGS